MKKILSVALAVVMLFAVVALAGCSNDKPDAAATLKFGMGVVASYGDATSADGETNGAGEIDSTAVAVLLDADNKIVAIDLDTAQIGTAWTAEGKVVETTELRTKYEKGTDYGMAAYGHKHDGTDGKVLEWNEQADAFMNTVKGKTLDEVKAMMGEDTYATGDLATAGCTISVASFVSALEAAINNAADSAATAADTLNLAMVTSVSNTDATEEAAGSVQVNTTIVAAVVNAEGKVVVAKTDCVQASNTFDTAGASTTDTTAAIVTKYNKGTDYGMAAAALDKNGDGKSLEWNEQADAFSTSIAGKTAAEIGGLVVEGYGTEEIQTAGCTIAIGDMVAAAVKAATVA